MDCNGNLHSVQESSEGITNVVQEISKGDLEQAESTNHINESMRGTEEKIKEVFNFSKQLAESSLMTNAVVIEGTEKINNMDKHMD